MKGGPFALRFRWPDLASVVSVKSGPISVRFLVWKKSVNVKSRAFFLERKMRQLKMTRVKFWCFDKCKLFVAMGLPAPWVNWTKEVLPERTRAEDRRLMREQRAVFKLRQLRNEQSLAQNDNRLNIPPQ